VRPSTYLRGDLLPTYAETFHLTMQRPSSYLGRDPLPIYAETLTLQVGDLPPY